MDFLTNFERSKNIKKLFKHIFIIPESPLLDSNFYIITKNNEYMLIDSGNGISFNQTIKAMKKIPELENGPAFKINNIKKILMTHCHIDHILGLYKFYKKIYPKPQIISSEQEAIYIEKAEKKVIIPIAGELLGPMISKVSDIISGSGIYPINVDIKLKDNDHLKFGDFDYKIIHTPGHTPGGICLFEEEFKILFTGDTVFTNGSFGRIDFPMGNKEDLVSSLKRLSEMDVELLLPGHMSPVLSNGTKHLKAAYNIASNYL